MALQASHNQFVVNCPIACAQTGVSQRAPNMSSHARQPHSDVIEAHCYGADKGSD